MEYKRYPKVTKKCLICGKEFIVIYARRYKQYCSRICGYKGTSKKRKENNPGGFKKRRKVLINITKKEYDTLHHWISRNFGKPNECEKCGRMGLSGKYINWANKNGEYNRERKNWIRLCRKCHYWHDTDTV